MKILVCISNVPDTTTKIKLLDGNKKIDESGIQWIINPWDELALTRALELKEAHAGEIESISVAGVGGAVCEPTLRKALAIGADNAYRIDTLPLDAFYTATQLAALVKQENFDLVLCGIESSDFNGSAVGGMLSELLAYKSVSSVSGLDVSGSTLQVDREIDGGNEQLELSAPAVLIVQKGIAIDPRIPSMRGIMMARKKPLNVVPAVEAEALTEYVQFEMPAPKAACKLVDEENAGEIIRLLHTEAKVL